MLGEGATVSLLQTKTLTQPGHPMGSWSLSKPSQIPGAQLGAQNLGLYSLTPSAPPRNPAGQGSQEYSWDRKWERMGLSYRPW